MLHDFQTIDWSAVPITTHPGETGTSTWQTIQLPGLRIRIVKYSAGYLANHWCGIGHIVHCLEGALISELEDGTKHSLNAGMSYVVSDNHSSHRSRSERGATLLIVDGAFLAAER